jgi:ankyrin repeat protein
MFAWFDVRRQLRRGCFILVPIALVAVTLGASAAVVQAAPTSVTFSAHTDYAAGQQPRSVAMGDVNGDTFLDLATANFNGDDVSVLLGNGAGGFGPSADLATGAAPHSVAMGDVNGDTFPDLATANFEGGSVSVLLGDGAGGFGAHTDFITGGAPISVAVTDLNGDTRLDLAVANWYSQTVQVLLGDGAGGFAAPSSYPVNGTPHSVAVRDLNGDLVPDLAVANGGTATVSVLLGDGAGGFGGHIDYATGAEPRSVVAADVNGDLVPDLATANNSSASVSVLLGDGTGGFGAKTDFATGSGPFSIAVGDLNDDLLLDLATANSGSASVSVLLGDGTGGFGTRTDFATGVGPESVAVGDLNGDLRLDVGAANRSSDSVSVLLNTTGPATVPGAPTIGQASVIYPSVTVSWTATSDGGSPLTGYVVTPYIDGIPQSPVTFTSTATAETINGLTDGVTYTFTVAAINAVGTGPDSTPSNPVTVARTAPGPPIIGTATAGNGRATVSWTAPALDGGSPITGYIVTPYVSTFTGVPRTFNSTATTQTVTGLTNGWPYRFRVQAINALGTGGYSAETNRVTPTAG